MARKTVVNLMGVSAGMMIAVVVFASHPVLREYPGADADHLGAAIAFGDVNGDGAPDLVMGADAAGYVRVVSGLDLVTELRRFASTAAGDSFGIALAVGDLNGDNHADVVVGAPSWNAPGATKVGYVQAFDGATGRLLFELRGQRTTDTFGSSLALGDVTGDGTPDLLVGAPFADSRGTNDNNGYVALYDGATQRELFRWWGAEHFDEMGRSVAFGDVNGDGTLDILLGAGSGNLSDYGGYVLVIDGRDFTQPLYTFTDGLSHVKPEQNFGFAVTAADVNDDGYADVIVGAYRGQNSPARRAPATGYVRVYSGVDGALLYQRNGDSNGEQFGRAVAAADVNGDGVADVIIGARFGAQGGYVRVFDGPTGVLLHEEVGGRAFDGFGQAVAAGDVNGDGRANLAVGASQGDTRAVSQGGYVRLYTD